MPPTLAPKGSQRRFEQAMKLAWRRYEDSLRTYQQYKARKKPPGRPYVDVDPPRWYNFVMIPVMSELTLEFPDLVFRVALSASLEVLIQGRRVSKLVLVGNLVFEMDKNHQLFVYRPIYDPLGRNFPRMSPSEIEPVKSRRQIIEYFVLSTIPAITAAPATTSSP